LAGAAIAVGYEEARFFGRLFKRKINLAPVQYRRRFDALPRSLGATSDAAKESAIDSCP